MTDRELMQMALDAMQQVHGDYHMMPGRVGPREAGAMLTSAIQALVARLAQPEQPDYSKAGFGKPQHEEGCAGCGKKTSDGWALYCVKCSEPQREWVGLKDEEVDGYWDESVSTGCKLSFGMGVDYANRVLKEKNSG